MRKPKAASSLSTLYWPGAGVSWPGRRELAVFGRGFPKPMSGVVLYRLDTCTPMALGISYWFGPGFVSFARFVGGGRCAAVPNLMFFAPVLPSVSYEPGPGSFAAPFFARSRLMLPPPKVKPLSLGMVLSSCGPRASGAVYWFGAGVSAPAGGLSRHGQPPNEGPSFGSTTRGSAVMGPGLQSSPTCRGGRFDAPKLGIGAVRRFESTCLP
mmetsp:Transcript_37728/g.118120  ORF Transcript_37728/g.118120 Transcript_37728/m.118120 type:complete len:211 (+) Transcript_37728:1343-1975(+)